MKYYIDTEFHERGSSHPIQLISLGVVAEDGREYYAECGEVIYDELSPWLKDNVVPLLNKKPISRAQMAEELLVFFGYTPCVKCNKGGCIECNNFGQVSSDESIEFWGYFSDYDWVVFCQIFGRMIDLPTGMPMYCNDVKQLANQLGAHKSTFPKQSLHTVHNAIADARWTKKVHEFLLRYMRS